MKNYSIKELVEKIQNKEITSEEVVRYYLKKLKKKKKI